MSGHFKIHDGLNSDAPHIYKQNEDGTFEALRLSFLPQTDLHGAGFFDLDNDGRMDLLNLTGRTSHDVLIKNEGNFNVVNRAVEFGLENENGRGRMPTFVDVNGDGFTDVIVNNQSGAGLKPTTLYLNRGGTRFEDSSSEIDFPQNSAYTTLLGRFTLTQRLEILQVGEENSAIYRFNENRFVQRRIFSVPHVNDAIVGDFSGNLMQDVFFIRGKLATTTTNQMNDTTLRGVFFMHPNHSPTVELRFKSPGNLSVHVSPRHLNTNWSIIAGEGEPQDFVLDTHIDLDWDDPALFEPDVQDPPLTDLPHWNIARQGDEWVFTVNALHTQWTSALEIRSDSVITDVNTVGVPESNIPPYRNVIFFNDGEGTFHRSGVGSADDPINAFSAVAADFDNDMDLDIYVVATNSSGNTANYLLENDGSGNFTVHEDAWGAAGTNKGVGESVSVVDYDNDGFMDLFVTNGRSIFFLTDAPTQLFRNRGNDNNWIKLELEGVQSNPEGIGATVICYAGGKAQLRVQDGGIHARAQNDQRIHFGLASNTVVDSILIHWPSRRFQRLYDVESNQILTVREPRTNDPEVVDHPFELTVYPQPSYGAITVKNKGAEKIKSLTLYNPLGQLMDEPMVQDPARSVDLHLKSGVYVIVATLEDGRSASKKIIIL